MPYANESAQKKAQQKHFQKNKEKYKEQLYARRKRNLEYVLEVKKNNPCSCGESHPACLDFHHRNEKDKDKGISHAVYYWGLERLKKEIEKCDVICANCHRKLHWVEPKDKYFWKD